MSEHTIVIKLKDGHAYTYPSKESLTIGDTVVYVTKPADLPFRVEFVDGSPFGQRQIRTSQPRKVRKVGKFLSRCFIETPDGNWVGWTPETPECGGEHDVKP